MVQLHTASTCNTPPDEIAQSLIPLWQTISPTAKRLYSPMKTLSSNLWVKGKPLHLFSSDCANKALVKIPADEVHRRGTSHGTETLSNPHPEASEQLQTAEIMHVRDNPLPPEPTLAPHMFDFFASKHTVSIPPCYDHAGVDF